MVDHHGTVPHSPSTSQIVSINLCLPMPRFCGLLGNCALTSWGRIVITKRLPNLKLWQRRYSTDRVICGLIRKPLCGPIYLWEAICLFNSQYIKRSILYLLRCSWRLRNCFKITFLHHKIRAPLLLSSEYYNKSKGRLEGVHEQAICTWEQKGANTYYILCWPKRSVEPSAYSLKPTILDWNW